MKATFFTFLSSVNRQKIKWRENVFHWIQMVIREKAVVYCLCKKINSQRKIFELFEHHVKFLTPCFESGTCLCCVVLLQPPIHSKTLQICYADCLHIRIGQNGIITFILNNCLILMRTIFA